MVTKLQEQKILVSNLLDRFETDPKTKKSVLKGSITHLEMDALKTAKSLLNAEVHREEQRRNQNS